MQIPVAHVEAGLRSFDLTMPKESDRCLTDQLSELLFVTSPEAIGYLANEGIRIDGIHFVGNPMIDTLLGNLDRFDALRAREEHKLPQRYAVATLHRPSNVDDPIVAKEPVGALHEIAEDADIFVPLHPRGRRILTEAGLDDHPGIQLPVPVGCGESIRLVRASVAELTDSWGVQEETTVLEVPCLTLRPNTERPITITHGTNQLVGRDSLVRAFRDVSSGQSVQSTGRPPLWDGQAGPRIADVIIRAIGELPKRRQADDRS